MIINSININNTFGAKIVGKLAEEITHKRQVNCAKHYSFSNDVGLLAKITEASKEDAEKNVEAASDALMEISYLARNAEVGVTNNNKSYRISIGGDTFYTSRGQDKESYNYPTLISALKHFK